MIWLIFILAIPAIYWAVHFTIIDTARDHLCTWPATILVFIILLILIISVSILIWCLCIAAALGSNVEINPQELVKIIESETPITVVNKDQGESYITYKESDALASEEIKSYTSVIEVRKSPNGRNYIEVYTATWGSSSRRFLYGKTIPDKYYIVYTTGD